MSKLTERIAELAKPIVEEEGCSLWDVEYVKEAGTWFLRIFIDRDEGVSIDDCERISRKLDPVLDEEDPIPESYVFEVGSAGADRILKRPSDFKQFMGSTIEISLYQPLKGSKRYVGVLNEYLDGDIVIVQGTSLERFKKEQIAQVRLFVNAN